MILDATTDSLQVILSANVATNQLPFTVSFDDFTASAVTPTKNVSVTNNVTAVDLIAAPSASHQRELKYCSIFNADTAQATVTVRFNNNGTFRTINVCTLLVGESMQYTQASGWVMFDAQGSIKVTGLYQAPAGIRAPEFFASANITTAFALATTNCYCLYLGKAERAFSSINFQYRTTVAITATVAWAELAVYKGYPTIASAASLTRLGYTNTAATWGAAAGLRTTNVALTNCQAGDDLWVVFSNSTSGTVTSIRVGSIVDDIGSGFFQTVANKQPSANATLTGVVDSTTVGIPYVSWQGI